MPEETFVIIRTDLETGEPFALFPYIPSDGNWREHCLSYQHHGQHATAHLRLSLAGSVAASDSQAQPLLEELVLVGYENLRVGHFTSDVELFVARANRYHAIRQEEL